MGAIIIVVAVALYFYVLSPPLLIPTRNDEAIIEDEGGVGLMYWNRNVITVANAR